MYRNVLVPTDGSEGAASAIDIALRYDATLHALHVLQVGDLPPGVEDDAIHPAFKDHAEEALTTVVEQAKKAGLENVEQALIRGPVNPGILQYADEQAIDLIVMRTHGWTGLDHYLLGSIAEKVVRHSEVPVLTVRMTTSETTS